MVQPDYTQRLERLLEISRKLTSNWDLTTLLQSIVDATAELIDCQDSSILILEEDQSALKFIAGPWDQISVMKQFRIPLDNSVAGWVITHCQPLVIQDAIHDPRIYREVDHALHYQTRSLLSVPMNYQSQPIGVLQALNKRNDAVFSSDDATILETLAAHAAIALHNVQLLDKSQDAYRQMVELDQMKNDFLSITSHELRAPLGLIIGHATYLRETSNPDQVPQLEVILRSAMRLKEIVEQFANVDNLKSGMALLRSEMVDLDHLVTDIVESFQEQARQKIIRLTVDTSGAAHIIECDPRKVRIALENLIKNALTFSDAGGRVWINVIYPAGCVRISVSDDGIGIPTKDLERIFTRFYQVDAHTSRRHRGMGLGLSIAKDMVEMHGGRIWVESVEGHGSRFTIQLPEKQLGN